MNAKDDFTKRYKDHLIKFYNRGELVVYYRNNLCRTMFEYRENMGWTFSEKYKTSSGLIILTKLIVRNFDFSNKKYSNEFRVIGTRNVFNIKFSLETQRLNRYCLNNTPDNNLVYLLDISGDLNRELSRYRNYPKKKFKKKEGFKIHIHSSDRVSLYTPNIPNQISWNMTHPYYGGRCSPR